MRTFIDFMDEQQDPTDLFVVKADDVEYVDGEKGTDDDPYGYSDDFEIYTFKVFKHTDRGLKQIGTLEYETYMGGVSGTLMGKDTPALEGYGKRLRNLDRPTQMTALLKSFLASKTGKKWAVSGKLRNKGLLEMETFIEYIEANKLKEADEVNANEIPTEKLKQLRIVMQAYRSKDKAPFYWSGIHGHIGRFEIPVNHTGGTRLLISDVKKLAKAKVRWIEQSGNHVSVGF